MSVMFDCKIPFNLMQNKGIYTNVLKINGISVDSDSDF